MATVNVNREVTDQFYRYKMPKLLAKVEGKGNGIKTVIVNMPEVAKALHRPPEYPCKYFGCELGAQTQFDYKNDRYIVNGSHDCNRLQELLDGFIKRFVLCPECDNPETNLVIKKGMILQRCIACGHQADVDMRHKLTTFILKNPPKDDQTLSTQGQTPNKNKKEKKSGKKSKEDRNSNGESPERNGEDCEEDGKNSPTANEDNDSDVEWGEDVSEEAIQKRMEEISIAARSMTLSDDLKKTPAERVNLFFDFIKKKKDTDNLCGAENEKEIVGEAERLDIRDKAPLVLAELLFDQEILKQTSLYRTLFLRFTIENEKAQKYLLGGIEQLVGSVHPKELMPKVPIILKRFYDLDILEEEILLDWDKKASKKYVSKDISKEIHEKAEPFIKWLRDAEEETSEEEEEEEDVQVDFTHSEKVGVKTIEKPKPVINNNTEEDDFDIDAI